MTVRALSFLCALGLLGLSTTSFGASTVLTERAIYRLADDIERASEAKDVQGILRHLSKSVVIEVRKRREPPETLDYGSYHARMTQTFPLLSYYSYDRSKEAVKIDDDGQSAVYRFQLEERYIVNGNYGKEKHTQEWRVVLTDGVPQVEKILVN